MSVSEREKQRVLDLHNEARREASGSPRPDLIWSNSLSAEAGKWARQMARSNSFDHENQKIMGENLYETDDHTFRYSSAVRSWIAEKEHYSGEAVGEKSKKKRSEMIGHYTQIICPEVTKVGMARARSRRYTYIVARYDYLQMRGTKPWGSATHLPPIRRTKEVDPKEDKTTSPGLESGPQAAAEPSQTNHRHPEHAPESSGTQERHQERLRERHSRHLPVSPKTHHRRRKSTTPPPSRYKTSLLEEIIEGMPRIVIKFPKISFHPTGRRKPRNRSRQAH